MVRLDLCKDVDPPPTPPPPQSQNLSLKEISPENHSLKLRQVLVLFLKLFPFSNAQYRQNFRLRRAFGARFPFSNTQILLKFSACGGRFPLVMLACI